MILLLQKYFPEFSGQQLRAALTPITGINYKQLGYNRGRQQLYGYIMNDPFDNAIYDIYSGIRMECLYDSMNTQCNKAKDLNCEHTIPQSFFAKKEPMVSDLYHCKISWNVTNNDRSNYPFQYVPDEFAQKYYGLNRQIVTQKPVDRENWSILDKRNRFEPRDIQKGDTARAVAYFYVRYPNEFESLKKTFTLIDDMIEWDLLFPATDLQNQQAMRIEEIQGNINPFIKEFGLVRRAYCDLSEGKYPCK
ncbi:Endonuclease I [Spironucleus salmonicida]|uniref:Endonuclease I n=1 Tax=Spironucleus salmonicida TaxID=348837 RepID=V6LCK8_9EUKA|nr:Endonuclease I [Spironucleus salmonicida]|eukprot:EST41411.1 Endonuclease I [Spironucleus salmonicida]